MIESTRVAHSRHVIIKKRIASSNTKVDDYDLVEALFEDCQATGRGTGASDFAESWGYWDFDSVGFLANQHEAIHRFMRDCNEGFPEGEEMPIAQHVALYRNEYLSSRKEAEKVPVHIWDVTEDADVLDQRAVNEVMRKVLEAAPGDKVEVAKQALGQLIAERS